MFGKLVRIWLRDGWKMVTKVIKMEILLGFVFGKKKSQEMLPTFFSKNPEFFNTIVLFSEITLMDCDILHDDLVEKETFDLRTLKVDETYEKTFTFRKVKQLIMSHGNWVEKLVKVYR